MFKNIQAILRSANLDSADDHRTAYCQLHVAPLTRDLANEVSNQMADSCFKLDKIATYMPRLEMGSSNWIPNFPLQNMEFRSHTELVQSGGLIEGVEVQELRVIRDKKYPDDFTLAMGIYFQIVDWQIAALFFERLKGPVALTFTAVGQTKLPYEGVGEGQIEPIGRNGKRRPLMQVSRHESGKH